MRGMQLRSIGSGNRAALMLWLGLLLAACTGGEGDTVSDAPLSPGALRTGASSNSNGDAPADREGRDDAAGRALFLANCAECHQANGRGIPNVYPALDGSEVVRGSGIDVALVLRIGRGEMPSFLGVFSDQETAALINYLRNAWSNQGDTLSAADIAELYRDD